MGGLKGDSIDNIRVKDKADRIVDIEALVAKRNHIGSWNQVNTF